MSEMDSTEALGRRLTGLQPGSPRVQKWPPTGKTYGEPPSPQSQASTAPPTPSWGFTRLLSDDDGEDFKWQRLASYDEEEEEGKLEEADEELERDEDGTCWIKTVGRGMKEVSAPEVETAEVQRQGRVGGRFQTLNWSHHKLLEKHYRRGPPPTISTLENMLAEVKTMFGKKYGPSVDDEDHDGGRLVDEDGTPWVQTVGQGRSLQEPAPIEVLVDSSRQRRVGGKFQTLNRSHHKMLARNYGPRQRPTMASLEEDLAQVKSMFESKYGYNVDAGDEEGGETCEYDEDGMLWIKSVGCGPAPQLTSTPMEVTDAARKKKPRVGGSFQTLDRSHHELLAQRYSRGPPPTLTALEVKLAEVKALYGWDSEEDDSE